MLNCYFTIYLLFRLIMKLLHGLVTYLRLCCKLGLKNTLARSYEEAMMIGHFRYNLPCQECYLFRFSFVRIVCDALTSRDNPKRKGFFDLQQNLKQHSILFLPRFVSHFTMVLQPLLSLPTL